MGTRASVAGSPVVGGGQLRAVGHPELSGGGVRLFEDGFPATSWSLTNLATSGTGAVVLVYDRR